jgi:hypothetical protein
VKLVPLGNVLLSHRSRSQQVQGDRALVGCSKSVARFNIPDRRHQIGFQEHVRQLHPTFGYHQINQHLSRLKPSALPRLISGLVFVCSSLLLADVEAASPLFAQRSPIALWHALRASSSDTRPPIFGCRVHFVSDLRHRFGYRAFFGNLLMKQKCIVLHDLSFEPNCRVAFFSLFAWAECIY